MGRLGALWLIVCAVAFAAGCGHAPTSPETPRSAPETSELPSPAPSAVSDPNEGQALLERVRAAFQTCTGAEAEAKSYSEGHFKAGSRVSELRHSTYQTRMIWVKPHKLRGDVLQTDNFLVGGAKMATLDGKNIRVKGAGLLGIFPLTLAADSDMLSSNRHHTFAEQTPDAICRRLLGANVRWSSLGAGTVAGMAVKLVELSGVTHLDNEITREVVAIEPNTGSLRGVTMYVGAHKVEDVAFTMFRWNPKPAADAFNI